MLTPLHSRIRLKLIWILLYGSFSSSLSLSSEVPVQLTESQLVAHTSLCVCACMWEGVGVPV